LIRELEPESFSPSELPEAFLSLQFDRQGDASCFASELSQSFVREAVLRLFGERRLRAFALFQNERMIAIDLYMMGTNSVCSWNGGFLSEAARWSPVKLLNNAAIKRAYELGLKEYDYLRGEHDYKRSWTNSRREVGRLEIDLRKLPTR
jgi:CelD/BcsL family acetyltransferase involved in cellulose biosynthesis